MLNQLIRLYNTMTTISTKGEDTLTMAECLKALREIVINMQQQTEAAQPEYNSDEE